MISDELKIKIQKEYEAMTEFTNDFATKLADSVSRNFSKQKEYFL